MQTPSESNVHAQRIVEHFLNLYEPSYESLLHYAALPLILTPELLHYLRHVFAPRTPWIAEADILLAESLCRQYSTYEQYLMHANIRAYLLEQGRSRPDFRLADAARVLLHYIDNLKRTRPYKSARELQAQAWSVMVYIDDEHRHNAAEQIKEALRRAGEKQPGGSDLIGAAELERLARIVEMLAPELKQHQALIEYARTIRALLKDEAVGERAYQRFLGEDMPSPAELTGVKEFQAARKEGPSPPPIQFIHGWSTWQVQVLQRQIAQALKLPVEFRDPLKDGGQGPAMVVIPGGRFLMGSPPNDPERRDDERQHEVEVASFALGKYAVTFKEYDRFSSATNREKPGDNGWGRGWRPVINVDWFDAVAYAQWLSQQTGQTYRLPTEAEWEYACRAGTITPFSFGTTLNTEHANYDGNFVYGDGRKGVYRKKTVEVGQFPANAWGLHNLHGNVWEWTGSEYDANYGGAELKLISAPNSGGPRVLRGGSWFSEPLWLRSAARRRGSPRSGNVDIGFRLARTLTL